MQVVESYCITSYSYHDSCGFQMLAVVEKPVHTARDCQVKKTSSNEVKYVAVDIDADKNGKLIDRSIGHAHFLVYNILVVSMSGLV